MPVYGLFDLKDKIGRYFKFSKEELKGILATILVLAFVISFREWGVGDEFSIAIGIGNFFISIVIVAVAVFIHLAAQKIYGLHTGFRVEYKIWWYGLVIALILVFLTRGTLWFLAAGGVVIHHLAAHRLGFFRYGTNIQSFGTIALVGPVANILFATFLKFFQVNLGLFSPENVLLNKIFLFNFAYAAWSFVPIPPLDGSRIFFYSRMIYFFIFGQIVSYVLLVTLFELYSFIWAFILGTGIWFLYYLLFERKAWAPLG